MLNKGDSSKLFNCTLLYYAIVWKTLKVHQIQPFESSIFLKTSIEIIDSQIELYWDVAQQDKRARM